MRRARRRAGRHKGRGVNQVKAVRDPALPHLCGQAAFAGWQGVVSEVHKPSGRIFPQLWHQGRSLIWRGPSRQTDLPSEQCGRPGQAAYGDADVAAMGSGGLYGPRPPRIPAWP